MKIDPALAAFDFHLPDSLISLRPAEPQHDARLLVVHTDGRLEDAFVRDLPTLLKVTDTLVFNDTKVLPAAMRGVRPARDAIGRDVDVDINLFEPDGDNRWWARCRPGRRLKLNDVIRIAADLTATVTEKTDAGTILLTFSKAGASLIEEIEASGYMPLPPYIARRRPADERDITSYQTTFAKGKAASVAAPTAGLHFTLPLLERIKRAGVGRQHVRLHVGQGTFSAVTEEQLRTRKLHSEWRAILPTTVDTLNSVRSSGGRIIPVGTTSLRTLESCTDINGRLHARSGPTELFLRPGDDFRIADALVTNFHLPRSSLFMLVCAYMGTKVMQDAYAHAIREAYRFYSYGDACLLLRGRATG